MSEEPRKEAGDIHLQQFGLKESTYERPNQNWVCGHLRDGTPCSMGPDAQGHCVASAECRPLRKGDRWVCTRRDAAGASCPCGEGPLPDGTCARPIAKCSPVRSLRARRARFAMAAFALSVGVLCFFLLGPDRSTFVSPGHLTDAHALILKANRASDCQACHAAGQTDARHWLTLAMMPAVGPVQNEKCLVCHAVELGKDAGLPHSLPAGTLERISFEAAAAGPPTFVEKLALFAPAAGATAQGQLACSTCHQEHGGRHQNIAMLADISCQVCHQAQFQSFAHGHPEFKAVREDQVGIVFDHALHESRMPDGKLVCARCHRPDSTGRAMLFTGFEQACAGCHAQGSSDHHGEQIRGEARVLLQLPQLSPDRASSWPGDTLTPLLQFLIAGDSDPATLQALKSLAANHWHTDSWSADDATQLRMAKAIERVVGELTLDNDSSALRARVARAAGVPMNSPVAAELLDQLLAGREMIQAWQQHALPHLPDDLAGKPAATAPAAAPPASTPAWKPPANTSGWFIDPDAVSVNYRPRHADVLDKSWIDLLAAGTNPSGAAKIVTTMPDPNFLLALRVELLAQHGGTCIKCHAVQPESHSYFVNWFAAEDTSRAIGYAKFDHRPHLTLMTGDDKCSICHKLQTAASSPPRAMAALFPTGTPNHGLAAHDKAGCAVCHNPSGASDTCLTCHEYHLTR